MTWNTRAEGAAAVKEEEKEKEKNMEEHPASRNFQNAVERLRMNQEENNAPTEATMAGLLQAPGTQEQQEQLRRCHEALSQRPGPGNALSRQDACIRAVDTLDKIRLDAIPMSGRERVERNGWSLRAGGAMRDNLRKCANNMARTELAPGAYGGMDSGGALETLERILRGQEPPVRTHRTHAGRARIVTLEDGSTENGGMDLRVITGAEPRSRLHRRNPETGAWHECELEPGGQARLERCAGELAD